MSYIQLLKLIEKYGENAKFVDVIPLEKGESNGK